MKTFQDLFETCLDGKGFVRQQDNTWLAYAIDYHTRHIPLGMGALYWVKQGKTKQEAIDTLEQLLKSE